jgi:hypothetical protein
MGYIIYDKKSTRIKSKAYKTHAAAQAQLTRMSKTWFHERYKPLYPAVDLTEDPIFVYGIAEAEYYARHIEKTVVKTNLMTGEEYRESVNTPLHMSPSSETYWSM